MIIVHELEKLHNLVAKLNLNSVKKLISIDGFFGTGKSMVSAYLAQAFALPVVYVDDYFAKDGKSLELFKFENFAATVAKLRQGSSTIVDGIMVQDVLARTGSRADFFIYVKEVNRHGIWSNGFKLDKLIRSDDDNLPTKPDRFEDELVEYHLRFRPHERADIIFELIEGTA
jgi:hypothetical protein